MHRTSDPCNSRARLAPSPTGALHLGNARTFLLTWLDARARGQTLLLRMEDLDHPKVKLWAREQALEDLRWLGLDWDEGPDCGGPHAPYTQSERVDHYAAALQQLVDAGRVYPCTCSRRDVEAGQSAPHLGDDGPRYPGTCRDRWDSYADACAALPDGRLPAWRFLADATETHFTDRICGPQTERVDRSVGDFVIARHAHGAGYMLGVVVDDAAMQVSEIMRGDDLLQTTHRQLLLQAALELPRPHYAHVPLVIGPDGRRLAKRHGDTRISQLRAAGVSPDRVLGYLAAWCGWAERGEDLSLSALTARFDLATLAREPVTLTTEDLDALGIST